MEPPPAVAPADNDTPTPSLAAHLSGCKLLCVFRWAISLGALASNECYTSSRSVTRLQLLRGASRVRVPVTPAEQARRLDKERARSPHAETNHAPADDAQMQMQLQSLLCLFVFSSCA